MFHSSNPNDKSLSAKDVFDVHCDIFKTFACTDITKNNKSYNKVFANESLSKYGFNWKEFSKELGFKTTPSFYITTNINYLKCCSELLIENWNSEKWRTFWYWIFTRRNIRITKKFEPLFYGFNGEFQRGQKQTVTNTEFNYINGPVFMTIPFNHFLTTEYIKNFKNIKFVKYVEVISEELKTVFIRIVSRNTWLSPKTKKYALLKLKHLKFIVGHPTILINDPQLDYTENFYDNIEKLYYRDSTFFNLKEMNDQKVFWSRGNGWALAGLARILSILDSNDTSRYKFEKLNLL